MKSIIPEMEAALKARFTPEMLAIIDDSAKHAGHAGARPEGNTHFTVKIVSAEFAGLSRVDRHRAVYDALKLFLENGLHALAIDAKAPGE